MFVRVDAAFTTRNTAPPFLREIVETCLRAGEKRLLIERHITGPISTGLILLQTAFLDGIATGLEIAMVDADSSNLEFLEEGIRLANVKDPKVMSFKSKSAAELWLTRSFRAKG